MWLLGFIALFLLTVAGLTLTWRRAAAGTDDWMNAGCFVTRNRRRNATLDFVTEETPKTPPVPGTGLGVAAPSGVAGNDQ